jgi:hypothetical protein
MKAIKDVQKFITTLLPRPYKVISIIGKIPPKFEPILASVAKVTELSRFGF